MRIWADKVLLRVLKTSPADLLPHMTMVPACKSTASESDQEVRTKALANSKYVAVIIKSLSSQRVVRLRPAVPVILRHS